jgi:hypothetical protein
MIWIPEYGARRISVHWRKSRVYDIPVTQLCARRRNPRYWVDNRWKSCLSLASQPTHASAHRFPRDIIIPAN